MSRYLSKSMEDLARQLSFAPVERRMEHMENAESLYWQIEENGVYPLDYVAFRVTGYRPETIEDVTLRGEVVRPDLLVFVEEVSETLDLKADDYEERPLDLEGVCEKLNVTKKTVSRYRRDGLFGRKMRFKGRRKKMGFLVESLERFLALREGRVEKAGEFTRIDDRTRHAILMRARRIVSRVEVSAFKVAGHLGKKFGRSRESVRRLLVGHDRRDPRVAIFPNRVDPLTEKQQRVIHRAYHRGVSVAKLAKRFRKGRTAVYRAINLKRAKALGELDIRYVYAPTFDLPDAEDVILARGSKEGDEKDLEKEGGGIRFASELLKGKGGGGELSPYLSQLYGKRILDKEAELGLFAKYNFLKFRASCLREGLDRQFPKPKNLDLIETYLRRAVAVKHELVSSNLRLVVSVARKHLAGKGKLGGRAGGGVVMGDLISEGNLVLMEAIETFDAGRGNRFSTYLSWALMRRFAQSMATAEKVSARVQGGEEYWPAEMNPNTAALEHVEAVTVTLGRLFEGLDERERYVLTRHFGLAGEEGKRLEPQTLGEVAKGLNVSAERARQIEHRAMKKLRVLAREAGIRMPVSDELGAI